MMRWRSLRPLDAAQIAIRDALGTMCPCGLKAPTHEAVGEYTKAKGHGVGYRLVCESCGNHLVGGKW